MKKSEQIDVIIQKLDEISLKLDGIPSKNQKQKVKREHKTPEDKERCTIKKKDGERCKGRLAKNNDEMCQLHLNKANGIDPAAIKKSKASV